MSGVTNYIVYSSSTLKAVVGQPNGSSRLCLSCHDGTVALGSVNSFTAPIQMQNGVTIMPSGSDNLGTDLSGDHPVSFVYNAALVAEDPTLNNPTTLTGPVKLDSSAQVQCVSCHDPHNEINRNDASYDSKCQACHAGGKPAAKACRVSKNNCVSCHMPKFELPDSHHKFTDHEIRVVRANAAYPN